MALKAWISAMRLRTLPLAASCVFAGAACAVKDGSFSVSIFLLALTTTVLLQILSNLANDYGDYSKGTDNAARVGPERALQSGAIQPAAMKKAIVVNAIAAFLCGVYLLYTAFGSSGLLLEFLSLLGLGLFALWAAYRYTAGKNPYGYRGYGDLFVFLFFGLVGVIGNAFLYAAHVQPLSLFLAIGIGALSTAVLNLNNLRDHENDKASGKITTVVKYGFQKGKSYHYLLVLVGANFCLLTVLVSAQKLLHFLPLVPLVLLVPHVKKVAATETPALLDPELKKVALTTFLFALLFWMTAA